MVMMVMIVMSVMMVMLAVIVMVMVSVIRANRDGQDLGWCISPHEGLGWGFSRETLLALSLWRCGNREFCDTGLP